MRILYAMAVMTGMISIASFQTVRGDEAATNKLAATCSTCEKTWVTESGQNGKIMVYQTEKTTECEGCKSAVAKYFKSGKFEYSCKSCGDLAACKVQRLNLTPLPPVPMELPNSAVSPKCMAVWVKESGNDGIFTVYASEKTEICSGCQDLAFDMITYGKTTNKCTGCDNELMVCNPINVEIEMAFAP